MSTRTIPGVPTDGLKPSDLLWTSILSKPLVFPPSVHSHGASDLPANIAFKDQANTFSQDQTINSNFLNIYGSAPSAGVKVQGGYSWYSLFEHRFSYADTSIYNHFEGSGLYGGWNFDNLSSGIRTNRGRIDGLGNFQVAGNISGISFTRWLCL